MWYLVKNHHPRLHDYPTCPPSKSHKWPVLGWTEPQPWRLWTTLGHTVWWQHWPWPRKFLHTWNFTTEGMSFRTRASLLEVMALAKMYCIAPGVIFKSYSVSFLLIYLFGNYYLNLWIVFHADFKISGRQPDSGPKPRTGRPSRGRARPTTPLKCGLNKPAQAGAVKKWSTWDKMQAVL